MTGSEHPPLHATLEPLAGLLGSFTGEGRGEYPTIEPFAYRETVTFGHVGKPFLAYTQRTSHLATGAPMHAESGYLRVVPASVAGGHASLELVLAHPTGIVEVEEGPLGREGGTLVLELATTTVAGTATAKDVRALRRRFVLDGDRLSYEVAMAHADTPMTHHLAAVLHRDG
ncbi:MAG: FABP family protein [Nitriliruptor sp.]